MEETTSPQPSQGPQHFAGWLPYFSGIFFSIVTLLWLTSLSPSKLPLVAAVLLGMIAGTYFGFAANDGRPKALFLEIVVALAFGALAVNGLWCCPILIPVGYFLHGFWDLFHCKHGAQAEIPGWFIPFCVVYDWIVGAFLLILWWRDRLAF